MEGGLVSGGGGAFVTPLEQGGGACVGGAYVLNSPFGKLCPPNCYI